MTLPSVGSILSALAYQLSRGGSVTTRTPLKRPRIVGPSIIWRTTIPVAWARAIEAIAKDEGVTSASVVRDFIAEGLQEDPIDVQPDES